MRVKCDICNNIVENEEVKVYCISCDSVLKTNYNVYEFLEDLKGDLRTPLSLIEKWEAKLR